MSDRNIIQSPMISLLNRSERLVERETQVSCDLDLSDDNLDASTHCCTALRSMCEIGVRRGQRINRSVDDAGHDSRRNASV